MKKITSIACGCLCSLAVYAADDNIAGQLNALVTENMVTTQAENMQGMMATIHSQSPAYQVTMQQMQPIFQQYNLAYETLGFEYIGRDQEYAVARIRQRTHKISGPDFKDNEIDMMQIYRQENGKWKIWSQAILNVTFLGDGGASGSK